MAKSFFERLTGSIRVREGEEAVGEKPEVLKKPAKVKESKPKKERFVQPAESRTEPAESDEAPPKNPLTREGRMERRFFASRGETSEPEEAVAEEESDETEGELTLDISDEGAYFIVQAMVAGVQPEDIDISFTDDTLTIRGVRSRQHEVQNENYYAKELYWGKFSRSVVLPEEVDSEKAEASLKNGLLTLKLPKKSYIGAKKIKIKTD